MAGDDLLHQRGPRAGHAQDQQRRLIGSREVSPFGEETGCKAPDDPVHARGKSRLIETEIEASDTVGRIEMPHGALVVP